MSKENDNSGKKYYVTIEGVEYPWDKNTISVAEIRTLGKIPLNIPIVEEFPNGTERTLGENEIIEIKPGHGFGRSPKYKRG